jgi:hypothetical protein
MAIEHTYGARQNVVKATVVKIDQKPKISSSCP